MRLAPETFETVRLRGERFRAHNVAELRTLDADPAVQAMLFGGVRTEEETRTRVQRRLTGWEADGFGDYVVRLRDGPFVGTASLFRSRAEDDDIVEIGYAVCPEHWGKGLATEMTVAVLTIAFTVLELPAVHAATDPANRASRRVMEKCGMEYVRDYLYHGNGAWPSVLYGIDRARWLERHAQGETP
ncbi:MAG: GNAT family N-acetyltransferase [Candidatus Elarobacter sp.]